MIRKLTGGHDKAKVLMLLMGMQRLSSSVQGTNDKGQIARVMAHTLCWEQDLVHVQMSGLRQWFLW